MTMILNFVTKNLSAILPPLAFLVAVVGLVLTSFTDDNALRILFMVPAVVVIILAFVFADGK